MHDCILPPSYDPAARTIFRSNWTPCMDVDLDANCDRRATQRDGGLAVEVRSDGDHSGDGFSADVLTRSPTTAVVTPYKLRHTDRHPILTRSLPSRSDFDPAHQPTNRPTDAAAAVVVDDEGRCQWTRERPSVRTPDAMLMRTGGRAGGRAGRSGRCCRIVERGQQHNSGRGFDADLPSTIGVHRPFIVGRPDRRRI